MLVAAHHGPRRPALGFCWGASIAAAAAASPPFGAVGFLHPSLFGRDEALVGPLSVPLLSISTPGDPYESLQDIMAKKDESIARCAVQRWFGEGVCLHKVNAAAAAAAAAGRHRLAVNDAAAAAAAAVHGLSRAHGRSKCVFRRYDDMVHGFCGARGDYSDPRVAAAAGEATAAVADFFINRL